MKLSDLLRGLDALPLSGPDAGTVEVRAVTSDSRRAGEGTLFVAVPGTAADGHDYAAAAVAAGAPAVLVEREVEGVEGAAVLKVEGARRALGLAAANLYGRPAERLVLVGVTGTNGKTSITWLLEAIAEAAGRRTGVLGTTGYRFRGEARAASHTTPGPEILQGLLAEMVDGGVDLAVLEVSSHALDQARVEGCRFDAAAFTNLTRDHLDYHESLEAYFGAKARLFTDYLADDGAAVVNLDDEWGRRLAGQLAADGRRVVGTTASDRPEGAVRVLSARMDLGGIEATLALPDGERLEIASPLTGAHNLANLCTAVGLAFVLGFPHGAIVRGLAGCTGAPGRLERVADAGSPDAPRHVFVDYAHTDDALARVVASLRALAPEGARIVTVFGAGGDRDRGKRPLMGEAASASDVVVVTSDNPRSEDPESIIDAVAAGVRPGTELYREADRGAAIALAVGLARPGDVVLVAGKGHETTQTLRGEVRPFDDRVVAREALAAVAPLTRPVGEEPERA